MQSARVMILGSTGQLGAELTEACQRRPDWEVKALSHDDVDITDASSVEFIFRSLHPQIVINATAYNQVELASKETDRAMALNATAVERLAEHCHASDAFLVHFSTDYVFDGKLGRPYVETDSPSPLNTYGRSKLAGEEAIRSIHPDKHAILRTCALYGRHCSPRGKRNFVELMLEKAAAGEPLAVRDDLVISPTCASGLAAAACQLLERDLTGTFHAAHTGTCTWHEFAREIFKLAHLSPAMTSNIPKSPTAVARPAYSALSSARLEAHGIRMGSWQEALAGYLQHERKASV